MAFPTNPNPGDTYTDEYGTVWVYAGPINGWYRQTVIPVNDTTYIGSDGAPGGIGNNTEVVFNDNGSLASDSGLTYNKTTDALSGGAFVPTGSTVPSNGVYLPSANNVAISTNGTGRLFVSDTGNVNIDGGTFFLNAATNRVGIGTPSAVVDARLTIGQTNDSAGVNTLRIYRGEFTSAYAEFSGIGGGAIIDSVNGSGGVIVFKGDGTERARIDSSGRLGLGTSSPSVNLDVSGTASVAASVGSTSTDQYGQLRLQTNNQFVIGYGSTHSSQPNELSLKNNIGDLTFYTNAQERVRIDISGNVGIGTTSPSQILTVGNGGQTGAHFIRIHGSNSDIYIGQSAGTVFGVPSGSGSFVVSDTSLPFGIGTSANQPLLFGTNGAERARIDSSGRLLVGTTTTSAANTVLLQASSAGSTTQAILTLARGQSSPADAALLGSLRYADSGHVSAAEINVRRDGGTWTSGTSQPTRIEFSTTADGASSPTERMRITSNGSLLTGGLTSQNQSSDALGIHGIFASLKRSNDPGLLVGRDGADGVLVYFYQDGSNEGSISVSGTTVSYNGAHLSRWSQLPGGAERTEILRGTVLSNIDEMCGWGEEENEQLNRMKVSDVEGDPNVSGVFQSWDDDDDMYTDDFYCAMTGDFIIRIGVGVTVQRGDLLMSAGDGTAKPQDDDIIRSKTIAKVTSTYVTCTYDDGSYCVPCVLMAC